jgi:hypothetical protein
VEYRPGPIKMVKLVQLRTPKAFGGTSFGGGALTADRGKPNPARTFPIIGYRLSAIREASVRLPIGRTRLKPGAEHECRWIGFGRAEGFTLLAENADIDGNAKLRVRPPAINRQLPAGTAHYSIRIGTIRLDPSPDRIFVAERNRYRLPVSED